MHIISYSRSVIYVYRIKYKICRSVYLLSVVRNVLNSCSNSFNFFFLFLSWLLDELSLAKLLVKIVKYRGR